MTSKSYYLKWPPLLVSSPLLVLYEDHVWLLSELLLKHSAACRSLMKIQRHGQDSPLLSLWCSKWERLGRSRPSYMVPSGKARWGKLVPASWAWGRLQPLYSSTHWLTHPMVVSNDAFEWFILLFTVTAWQFGHWNGLWVRLCQLPQFWGSHKGPWSMESFECMPRQVPSPGGKETIIESYAYMCPSILSHHGWFPADGLG